MSRAQLTSTVEQNSAGAAAPVVAGKNLAINGLQEIWQRGTSFSGAGVYTSDRWYSGTANTTYAQETSVVPTGIRYAMKMTTSTTGVAPTIWQAVETANAIQFAGQTVTLSFYARSTDAVAALIRLDYSTTSDTAVTGSYTSIGASTPATTSTGYTRVSAQFAVPSNALTLRLIIGAGANLSNGGSFYITGIQLEAGSVATPFSRTGGTLQGELALCQRYYVRFGADGNAYAPMAVGLMKSTTNAEVLKPLPVRMRTAPSAAISGNFYISLGTTSSNASALSIYSSTTDMIDLQFTTGTLVAGSAVSVFTNNSTASYIEVSAEL